MTAVCSFIFSLGKMALLIYVNLIFASSSKAFVIKLLRKKKMFSHEFDAKLHVK